MKTLKNYIRRVIKNVIKEAISNNQQFLFNRQSIPHSVLNNFTPQKITTAYKQFKLKLDPKTGKNLAPGFVFPLYVNTAESGTSGGLEVGKWYKSGEGESWYNTKNGKLYTKGKGYDVNDGNKIEWLSYRPGWHTTNTPWGNQRCYMVFEDGCKEEVNESRNTRLKSIINECVDRCLRKYLNENTKYSIPKFLYHATPSCYLSSIKKNGLGGKIPRKRFWDYDNTEYANIRKGCFLATDEYVAESYLEASEEFEAFSEWYEERYDKELNIVVFKIPTSNLDLRLLKIDTNQLIDDETEPTYFYDGVIPYNQMSIIQLY